MRYLAVLIIGIAGILIAVSIYSPPPTTKQIHHAKTTTQVARQFARQLANNYNN